ncbi:11838_t:CDS:2 [Entrophospora sp. SA101]|nr:11838_t:CDS:2 [Entrophospora sp. SA101]
MFEYITKTFGYISNALKSLNDSRVPFDAGDLLGSKKKLIGGPKYMEHIKAGPEDDKESDVEESEEESDIEDEKKVKRVIMKRKKEKVVMKTMNKKCQRPPGGSQHPNIKVNQNESIYEFSDNNYDPRDLVKDIFVEDEFESTCEVDRNTVEQYGNDLFEIGVVIYDQNMLYKEKQQQLQTEQNKLHDTQEYLACDCNLAKLCKIVPQFPLNQQIAPVLCIFVRIVLKLMEAISVKEWGRVIRGYKEWINVIEKILAQGVYMTERQITKGRGAKDLRKDQNQKSRQRSQAQSENIVMDWANDNTSDVQQT